MKLRAGLFVLFAATAVPQSATAHVPQESTAHVSLRDGHAVIALEFDLVGVLEHEHADRGELRRGQMSSVALEQALNTLELTLANETQVRLDGELMSLEVHDFPSANEVQRQAVEALVRSEVDPHAVAPRQKVRLRATQASVDAQTLSISLPAIIGRSFLTISEPRSRVVELGERATFDVNQDGATLSDEERPCPTDPTPWNAILLAFVGGALACVTGLRLYEPYASGRS